MKTRLLALVIGGMTLSTGAFAGGKAEDVNKDAVVREIDATVLRTKFAQNYRLLLITAEALPKVFPDEEDQRRLKNQVDFTKQQLILFAWSGGGDDKLTYAVHDGGKSVIFRYDAGTEKKKLKSQIRAFAIPKDASWATTGWPFVDPFSIPKPASPR